MEVVSCDSESLREAKRLMEEYASTPGVSECAVGFREEIAQLPGRYGPPSGDLLLAREGERCFGIVAIRKIDDGCAEIKRLYVEDRFRGKGSGERLAVAAIERATELGYRKVRLDTLLSMTAAIHLYERLGFVRIPRYYDGAPAEAIFFELSLAG